MHLNSETKPEIWKAIPGYEGLYSASSEGRIRRDIDGEGLAYPGMIMSQRKHESRNEVFYMKISLFKDGKQKTHRVHRLILSAFQGPCPEGMEGAHDNLNGLDNRVENLHWKTHSMNMNDYYMAQKEQESHNASVV